MRGLEAETTERALLASDDHGQRGAGMMARVVADVDELDALLEETGKRGFLWHLFRTDRHGPEVLAGVLQRPGCADVFVLSDAEHAHVYRVPTGPGSDVFAPRDVLW